VTDGTGREGPHGTRLGWVEDAIAESRRWADAALASASEELSWSAPGDWDYDYSLDQRRIARQAEQTIAALEAERELILGCQRHFRSEHPPAP
jgi:hypothetical protein